MILLDKVSLLTRTALFALLLFSLSAVAEELKDALYRDENISNTQVISHVLKRPDGFYEYTYDVISDSTNKGKIADFDIDISCNFNFGEVVFPEPPYIHSMDVFSEDGFYVPVQAYGVAGSAAYPAIAIYNSVGWVVPLNPGDSAKGMRILSPAPPGNRTYKLTPIMDADGGWNYHEYDEDDPNVPWIDDFTVTGIVVGPSCPDTTPGGGKFEGTGNEPFGVNKLLTYSAPEADPVQLDSASDSLDMTIHYDVGIDPNTFSAKLNGADVSSLFSPTAGKSETVKITGPWKTRNKLSIKVIGIVDNRMKGVSPEKRPSKSWTSSGQYHPKLKFDEKKGLDNDIFHITFAGG